MSYIKLYPLILFFSYILTGCNQTPVMAQSASAESWTYLGQFKATAYCSCKLCCGKSDGITASGKQASEDTIACNWLPFGTKLKYAPRGYNSVESGNKEYSIGTVLDRGAKSLFGSKHNHIKHIDLWHNNHRQAQVYGVRWVDVWVQNLPR